MKEYQVTVQDKTFQLSGDAIDAVRLQNGAFHLLQDNKAYQAEVVAADFASKTFTIEVNGRSYEVQIADQYDQLVKQLGLSSLAANKANDVKAPMPGLVLELEVQEGQAVKKGDGLLILEAMKMENIIKSAGDGIVKSIRVEKGMAVEKGQLLIEMESA